MFKLLIKLYQWAILYPSMFGNEKITLAHINEKITVSPTYWYNPCIHQTFTTSWVLLFWGGWATSPHSKGDNSCLPTSIDLYLVPCVVFSGRCQCILFIDFLALSCFYTLRHGRYVYVKYIWKKLVLICKKKKETCIYMHDICSSLTLCYFLMYKLYVTNM